MNKPNGISDKVWDMAVNLWYECPSDDMGIDADHAYCTSIALAISKAIEEEREAIAEIVEHMLRFADTTSSADQVISQAIRSLSKGEE